MRFAWIDLNLGGVSKKCMYLCMGIQMKKAEIEFYIEAIMWKCMKFWRIHAFKPSSAIKHKNHVSYEIRNDIKQCL